MGFKKYWKSQDGFTLAEIIIATAVFMIAFVGILLSYLRSVELSELSRNSSTAVQAARSRMEQIKDTSFSQIMGNYNIVTFTAAGLNGKGVSYVDNTNPDLLLVTISFCWQQKNGKIIGEDSNLNGLVDAGEDKNGNGMIDSPVQLVSYVYDK